MSQLSSKKFVSILAGGVSLLALGSLPATAQQSAQADQPAASNGNGLEEIVVTARRKEEKAQSVPIAISNVTSAQMEEQKILSPSDLSKDFTGFSTLTTGNRSVSGISVGGNIGNGYQWIRGVPGVIPYWGDAPTVLNGGLQFDVSSVQVLKGPQGTLFGQATNGGAIVLQPKLPTNVFEGFVMAELGDYGHTNLNGVINIPVVDDKFLVRVGGRTVHTDGFVYDIAHKTWLGSENNQSGRLAITIRPMDNLQNDFLANAYNYNDVPNVNQYLQVAQGAAVNGPGQAGIPLFTAVNIYGATAPNTCAPYPQCLITYNGPLGWYAIPGNPNVPFASFETGHWYNLVNTTRWDVSDDITIKNIIGYTEGGAGTGYTASNFVTSYPPSYFGNGIASGSFHPSGVGIQTSEELQILGKAFDGKLSYSAGAFGLFSQGSSAPHVPTVTCSRVTNGGIQNGGVASSCFASVTYVNDRSQAVYAQATYDFSDFVEGLTFTPGVRYTWDQAYGSVFTFAGTPQFGNAAQVVNPTAVQGFSAGESSKAFSYNMSLDWQIDSTTLLYVTNSKGFSKGGVNNVANIPVGPGRSYAPESLNNIEAGIKADWDLPYEAKARTNISLFYGMYDNVQDSKLIQAFDPNGNITGTAVVTANAATAHVQGIDFDLTLIPTDDVQISYGGVLADPRYDTYNYCTAYLPDGVTCKPGATVDYSTSVWDVTPKWTWHVRVAYTLPIDESLGKATIAANLSHVGPYYGSIGVACTGVVNGVGTPDGCPAPPTQNHAPATNNVDLSMSWKSFLGRTGLDATGFVTNLFGAHYGQGAVPTYASSASYYLPVAAPRQWGGSLKYSFGP